MEHNGHSEEASSLQESVPDWEAYAADLQGLCQAKAEEFDLLGYASVKPEHIWTCVAAKWKKKPSLHEAVSDILSLQIGQLMNNLTVNAYKGKFDEDDAPFLPTRPAGPFDRPNGG